MAKLTFMVSQDGKLPVGIAQTLTARLKEFAGQKCVVSLELAKDKRSLDQNAFLWGVVYNSIRQFHLEQGSAYSIEQIHEACLVDFAPKVELVAFDGSIKLAPMRSRQMNVEQMAQYIRNIEVALADFGVVLPAHEKYKD